MSTIDWNKGMLEIYVQMPALESEDINSVFAATQFGEEISEIEADLFAKGADIVKYQNRTFEKIEDIASRQQGYNRQQSYNIRELRYQSREK